MYTIKINYLGKPEEILPCPTEESAREAFKHLELSYRVQFTPYNDHTVTMISCRLEKEMLVFMPDLY